MNFNERLDQLKALYRALNNYENDLERKVNAITKQTNETVKGWRNSEALDVYEEYIDKFDDLAQKGETIINELKQRVKIQIENIQREKNNQLSKYLYLERVWSKYDKDNNLEILNSIPSSEIDDGIRATIRSNIYRAAAYKGW